MGRWKNDGSGNPIWDANDSGPDQIQGMPAGGPQQPQGGGGFQPPTGGVSGMGPNPSPQGQANGQPFQGGGFNPPNAWAQPEEKEVPGWGPIKISTHFQPGDGYPHPFENGFNVGGGSAKGGPQGIMAMPAIPDWYKGPVMHTSEGDAMGDPFAQPPGGQQQPPWKELDLRKFMDQGANPNAPQANPGESDPEMFNRYNNDYHAPDRDQVMNSMYGAHYQPPMHLMDGMHNATGAGGGAGVPQSGGILGAILGRSPELSAALQRSQQGGVQPGGSALNSDMLKQLIARMNGGA
jgi:hypothetical protein